MKTKINIRTYGKYHGSFYVAGNSKADCARMLAGIRGCYGTLSYWNREFREYGMIWGDPGQLLPQGERGVWFVRGDDNFGTFERIV